MVDFIVNFVHMKTLKTSLSLTLKSLNSQDMIWICSLVDSFHCMNWPSPSHEHLLTICQHLASLHNRFHVIPYSTLTHWDTVVDCYIFLVCFYFLKQIMCGCEIIQNVEAEHLNIQKNNLSFLCVCVRDNL